MVKRPLKNSWRSRAVRFSHLLCCYTIFFSDATPPWNKWNIKKCNKTMLLKTMNGMKETKNYYTKIKIHGSIPPVFISSVRRAHWVRNLFILTFLPCDQSMKRNFLHLIFVFLPQNSFLCKFLLFLCPLFFFSRKHAENEEFRPKTSAHQK